MQREKKLLSKPTKIAITVLWAVLFTMLLRRDYFLQSIDIEELRTMQQAEEEEYQSIYFKQKKIGYVRSRFTRKDQNSWIMQQQAYMKLNVAGTSQDIQLKLEATLSTTNLLKEFSFAFRSPFYKMEATGTVTGNRVSYILDTGANIIQDFVIFNDPPLLATSRRGYLLAKGLDVGEKLRVPWFDPFSLTGKESVIEYRGKELIRIGGRVHNLHRFTESFSGARISSWLNDSGVIVKEESPAGFVFQKEPKFKALSSVDAVTEILSAVAVQPEGTMPENLALRQTMNYRLTIPRNTDLDIAGGRQQFDGQTLTLTREQLPKYPTDLACEKGENTLQPSPYIQSDNKTIHKLATELTSSAGSKVKQIHQLSTWVYHNLEKRPVLGLPDALTTLRNKQGDCNEHAALFAALARSIGIPSRIVAGVTYHKEAFYYHAWNEVCLADNWISLDTTTNQFPADLSHIRFITGEIKEQVRISGLLGNLSIQPLSDNNY